MTLRAFSRRHGPLFAPVKIRDPLAGQERPQVYLGQPVPPELYIGYLCVGHVRRVAYLAFDLWRKVLELVKGQEWRTAGQVTHAAVLPKDAVVQRFLTGPALWHIVIDRAS